MMYIALLFMVLGGLVIWCCFADVKFFFRIVKTGSMGHTAARVVYGGIGLLLIVFSIMLFMDM
ncbi:hypothetical protein [Ruminococcus sp.]|uniref:hypothetical protein n=1 Tax=Ruminococcus sp. TaxID=41978 RepID=UPI0025F0E2DD|nr:hypothetical protein [Ruminococcus sp.]MBQ8965490.1 hypothetical protein [Ruminococcus sp.]